MSKTRLRFVFLAAAIGLSATAAFAQQSQILPLLSPKTLVGNMRCCGPQPGYAVTIPELIAELSTNGLVQVLAPATPGHAVVFGSVPNSVVDGGVPSGTGTGTVTAVTCGAGLSGGTFTTTGTCAVSLSNLTNSLGADVALNNTANYFDGPSVAQGVTGTWYASGTVTLTDTVAASFQCKLWDGTTVISSTFIGLNTNFSVPFSLSGFIASPTGNIRMSCRNTADTTGKMVFNNSGNSKDSTLTVFRIQ
jgi:hypothetical protein